MSRGTQTLDSAPARARDAAMRAFAPVALDIDEEGTDEDAEQGGDADSGRGAGWSRASPGRNPAQAYRREGAPMTHPEATGTGSAPARLSIRGVSKTFGRQRVLSDFQLSLRAGEVHALVGHNGSGKSTFVKLLSGFHEPDGGAEAAVDGAPFELGSASAATAAGLRFVHQDLGLVDVLDAVDNIHLGGRYPRTHGRRIDWAAARRAAREHLAILGLEFDVGLPVGTLTPSQRTAVAVARALRDGIDKGRVLVLDEPTAALPAREVEALFQVVRTVQAHGLAVLYISHHLEEVFAIAGTVSVLRDGVRVGTVPTSSLNENGLVELMLGHELADAAARPSAAAGHTSVLSVRGLGARALDTLDLEVGNGEIVGVTGVDGSGREELAGALFGAISRRGTVEIAGRPLPAGRPDLAARCGIGFVPSDREADSAMMGLSITDNLMLPSVRAKVPRLWVDHAGARAETEQWITRLDIRPPLPDARLGILSGGNQQKVILARWLRTEPKVLLLDEPTKGVDVPAVAVIWSLIREAAAQGTAVVVCSSDSEELAAHCDRALVLRHGTLCAQLQGAELTAGSLDALAISAEGSAVSWA